MSLTACEMQLLLDGGFGLDEFLVVARSLERGEDRRYAMSILDALVSTDASAKVQATFLVENAKDVLARRPSPRFKDEHSTVKDSNRSRRGMRDDRWRELRLEVFKRDGFECLYCGSTDDLTCDHILPLVRGGSNDMANLATACRPCNSSKGDRLLAEWGGRQ